MSRTAVVILALVALVVVIGAVYMLSRQPSLTSTGTPAVPPAAPAGAPAAAVPTGPHPTPVEEVFQGCPGEGDGTDPELNRLKNRVDTAAWQPITVDALLALKWPPGAERKHMAQWSQADRQQVAPYNGVPVQAEGYLLGVRQEGPESPNCHSVGDLDFHMWFVAQPTDDRATKSVVIEVTPRLRATHPGWTLNALEAISRQKERVRISGWTMLDPEHPDQVHQSRGTIWEIHPIVQIEVAQAGGGWRELQ